MNLVALKPWYRFHFHDGDHFDYGGTLEETLQEIARIEPRDCDGYRALLAHSQRIYDVGFSKLSAQPFDGFMTMVRQIPGLISLRNYETVWQMVSRYLTSEKLRQAFSIQPLLVGGNPFDTTSIYGLIHYLERAHGVHFAMGGTGAITQALGTLMERQGIEIKLNTTVRAVHIEGGVAKGRFLTMEKFFVPMWWLRMPMPPISTETWYRLRISPSRHALSLRQPIIRWGFSCSTLERHEPIPMSPITRSGWDHAIGNSLMISSTTRNWLRIFPFICIGRLPRMPHSLHQGATVSMCCVQSPISKPA